MSIRNRFLLALFALLVSTSAMAQVNSNTPSITLDATLPESITISVDKTTVNFALAEGQTIAGSNPVNVTTTWALLPTRTSVALYAFFNSATSALSVNSNNIPTSDIEGAVGAGTFAPFTSSCTFGSGTCLQLYSQTLTALTYVSTRTDALSLEINTPSNLPVGDYTGTLTLEAQAN